MSQCGLTTTTTQQQRNFGVVALAVVLFLCSPPAPVLSYPLRQQQRQVVRRSNSEVSSSWSIHHTSSSRRKSWSSTPNIQSTPFLVASLRGGSSSARMDRIDSPEQAEFDTGNEEESNAHPRHSSSTAAELVENLLPGQHRRLDTRTTSTKTNSMSMAFSLTPLTLFLQNGSQMYGSLLQRYPIRTKSITAAIVFALSDVLAQRLQKKEKRNVSPGQQKQRATTKPLQWSRIWASSAIGFFYFGPAAHFWYEWIFSILPGTSLVSILQKAILGQLIFGPTFTCVFFAAGLLQSGTFTVRNWLTKIRSDLPGAWIAGTGFWPIVDLISFSLVPPQWIPLFINFCSLIWTTYLALQSYAKS